MVYLGLDLGSKTLGLAISDYTNTIATSVKTIYFKDENSFYTSYIQYENETTHPGIYFKDYESCYKHIKNNNDMFGLDLRRRIRAC